MLQYGALSSCSIQLYMPDDANGSVCWTVALARWTFTKASGSTVEIVKSLSPTKPWYNFFIEHNATFVANYITFCQNNFSNERQLEQNVINQPSVYVYSGAVTGPPQYLTAISVQLGPSADACIVNVAATVTR